MLPVYQVAQQAKLAASPILHSNPEYSICCGRYAQASQVQEIPQHLQWGKGSSEHIVPPVFILHKATRRKKSWGIIPVGLPSNYITVSMHMQMRLHIHGVTYFIHNFNINPAYLKRELHVSTFAPSLQATESLAPTNLESSRALLSFISSSPPLLG